MWEFEIIWNDGERNLVFGYDLEDACRRNKRDASEVRTIVMQDYAD